MFRSRARPTVNHVRKEKNPFPDGSSCIIVLQLFALNFSQQDSSSTYILGKLEADDAVFGSGVGGPCCAGLLAGYKQNVLVLESHNVFQRFLTHWERSIPCAPYDHGWFTYLKASFCHE
ncbi:uncharacterized protein LOC103716623 [Phoenix dactylifera]|uniref:Uncharacterized protein LOC103716623 n=1 Tax=Phoenix dactylifera TaxID=42345 RepID=A0A8B9ASW1_PHODC|nr:uncharacterized protein LOC103716623 [Phoenix dactylifera]